MVEEINVFEILYLDNPKYKKLTDIFTDYRYMECRYRVKRE